MSYKLRKIAKVGDRNMYEVCHNKTNKDYASTHLDNIVSSFTNTSADSLDATRDEARKRVIVEKRKLTNNKQSEAKGGEILI